MFHRLNNPKPQAQSTVEFTFAMLLILVILFGVMMTFRWLARDLAKRSIAHDSLLIEEIDPLEQVDPVFYQTEQMNLVTNRWKKQ